MGKGLKKVMYFSDEFADLTGKKKGARTDATKWFWKYVKENGFNDPEEYPQLKDGREIAVEGKLKALTNKKKLHMTQVGGLLNHHLFDE